MKQITKIWGNTKETSYKSIEENQRPRRFSKIADYVRNAFSVSVGGAKRSRIN